MSTKQCTSQKLKFNIRMFVANSREIRISTIVGHDVSRKRLDDVVPVLDVFERFILGVVPIIVVMTKQSPHTSIRTFWDSAV